MKKLINQPDLGILIFRIFVGCAMFYAHGLGKVPPSEKMIAGVANMGFPLPLLFAWMAALSELIGGALIVVGLFTRYSAFFLAITMGVAGFIVHGSDPFGEKELALFYFVSSILLIFAGAGNYSLDRLIRKK